MNHKHLNFLFCFILLNFIPINAQNKIFSVNKSGTIDSSIGFSNGRVVRIDSSSNIWACSNEEWIKLSSFENNLNLLGSTWHGIEGVGDFCNSICYFSDIQFQGELIVFALEDKWSFYKVSEENEGSEFSAFFNFTDFNVAQEEPTGKCSISVLNNQQYFELTHRKKNPASPTESAAIYPISSANLMLWSTSTTGRTTNEDADEQFSESFWIREFDTLLSVTSALRSNSAEIPPSYAYLWSGDSATSTSVQPITQDTTIQMCESGGSKESSIIWCWAEVNEDFLGPKGPRFYRLTMTEEGSISSEQIPFNLYNPKRPSTNGGLDGDDTVAGIVRVGDSMEWLVVMSVKGIGCLFRTGEIRTPFSEEIAIGTNDGGIEPITCENFKEFGPFHSPVKIDRLPNDVWSYSMISFSQEIGATQVIVIRVIENWVVWFTWLFVVTTLALCIGYSAYYYKTYIYEEIQLDPDEVRKAGYRGNFLARLSIYYSNKISNPEEKATRKELIEKAKEEQEAMRAEVNRDSRAGSDVSLLKIEEEPPSIFNSMKSNTSVLSNDSNASEISTASRDGKLVKTKRGSKRKAPGRRTSTGSKGSKGSKGSRGSRGSKGSKGSTGSLREKVGGLISKVGESIKAITTVPKTKEDIDDNNDNNDNNDKDEKENEPEI